MRFQLPGACLAVFLLAGTARAEDPAKFMPDKTDMVVSINIKQMMNSEIFTKYLKDMVKQGIEDNAELKQFFTATGLDPYKDVERISFGMKLPEELGPGSGSPENVMLVAEGKWDAGKVSGVLAQAAQQRDNLSIIKEGAFTIYKFEGDNGDSMYLTILDDNMAVGSDSKSGLIDGIDRIKNKKVGTLASTISGAWAKADTNQSMVMLMGVKGKIEADAIPDPNMAPLLTDIDALSISLDMTKDLALKLNATYASKDAAAAAGRTLSDQLDNIRNFMTILAFQEARLMEPLADFSRSLGVKTGDKDVTLSGKMSGKGVGVLIDLAQDQIP